MPDEAARKELVLEYCRRMNAGDLDGVVALFAPDARFEDPVGAAPMIGTSAIRAHLAQAIGYEVRETPDEPTAAMDSEHVVIPVSVTLRPPEGPPGKLARINLISVIRVGSDNLIHDVRVYWGESDMALVDSV
ncbi:MAG TPA: nuclear transport factor 2 family protein [Micromonospora sp.]